jgi:hypothetical protein
MSSAMLRVWMFHSVLGKNQNFWFENFGKNSKKIEIKAWIQIWKNKEIIWSFEKKREKVEMVAYFQKSK